MVLYPDEKGFDDLKRNFHLLVDTCNHQMTNLSESNKEMVKESVKMSNKIITFSTDLKWLKLFVGGVLITLVVDIILKFMGK